MAVTIKNNVGEKKANLTLVEFGKKKPGRPKWKPNLVEVERLAAQGLTQEQIAHALSVSASTLYQHKKDFSEFSEAITRGAAKGIASITNALYNKAQTGDTTACVFFLKARGGWSDKVASQDPQHQQSKSWVEKIERDEVIVQGEAAHQLNVQIGQQTAEAAREVLRLLSMTEEEVHKLLAEEKEQTQ